MSVIRVAALFAVKPGKMSLFRELARDLVNITRDKDRGTLVYHYFIDEEASEVVMHEHYKDADSFREHITNISPVVGRMAELGTVEQIFVGGNVSEDVAAIFKSFTGETEAAPPKRCKIFADMISI